MSDATTTASTASKLSDGVVVSLVTAAAYSAAFAYEAGGAQAFGLPIAMVDLQLMPALFTTLISLSAILIIFQLGDPLLALLTPKKDDHPVAAELRAPIALLVMASAFWLVGGATVRPMIFWVGGSVAALMAFTNLSPIRMWLPSVGSIDVTQRQSMRSISFFRKRGVPQEDFQRVGVGRYPSSL